MESSIAIKYSTAVLPVTKYTGWEVIGTEYWNKQKGSRKGLSEIESASTYLGGYVLPLLLSDAGFLIRTAREAIESYLKNGKLIERPSPLSSTLVEPAAAFVTINKFQSGGNKELRGCIGVCETESPLVDVVIEMAVAASARDPRFPPLLAKELGEIVLEISILSTLSLVNVKSPKDYLNTIRVGKDGLVFHWRGLSGILLPQVSVEYDWGPEEFLSNVCVKAGAPSNSWLLGDAKIYRFQAEIFGETSPRGPVVMRNPQKEEAE